ncbi:hypothetical protein IU483_18575 [Streptomyces gardneri]|nr:hypothetical protein [Streptomyces gardneri]
MSRTDDKCSFATQIVGIVQVVGGMAIGAMAGFHFYPMTVYKLQRAFGITHSRTPDGVGMTGYRMSLSSPSWWYSSLPSTSAFCRCLPRVDVGATSMMSPISAWLAVMRRRVCRLPVSATNSHGAGLDISGPQWEAIRRAERSNVAAVPPGTTRPSSSPLSSDRRRNHLPSVDLAEFTSLPVYPQHREASAHSAITVMV